MNKPIEEWPRCDALLAFYSTGFPLKKAIEYCKKYKPYALNSLDEQLLLLDRRMMYDKLREADIPVPRNEYLSRDGYKGQPVGTLEV